MGSQKFSSQVFVSLILIVALHGLGAAASDGLYGECCECSRSSCNPGGGSESDSDGEGNCNTQGQPSDTCKDAGFNSNKDMCRDWCGGSSTNSTGNSTLGIIETSAPFSTSDYAPGNTTTFQPLETSAPFMVVPSPTISVTGNLLADGTYYNLAELTISSISGSSISSGTNEAELNCSVASESNEITITFTEDSTLYAIACSEGIASASSNQSFGLKQGSTITISVTLDVDIASITETVKSNIRNSLAKEFGLKPNQIILTIAPIGRRRLLAVSLSAQIFPNSEEQAATTTSTANSLDLAAFTTLIQQADPSLSTAGVSGFDKVECRDSGTSGSGTSRDCTPVTSSPSPLEAEVGDDNSVNGGLIAGVTVAAVALVAAMFGVAMYVARNGAPWAAQDIEHGPLQGKAEILPSVYQPRVQESSFQYLQPPLPHAQSPLHQYVQPPVLQYVQPTFHQYGLPGPVPSFYPQPTQYVQSPNLYESVTPITVSPGYVQPGGVILT